VTEPPSEWKYNPMTGEPLIDGWPLYSGLPQREWQELTDEEIKRYKPVCADLDSFRAGVKAVEAKLKEKNGG
jgi:hypothetical protein